MPAKTKTAKTSVKKRKAGGQKRDTNSALIKMLKNTEAEVDALQQELMKYYDPESGFRVAEVSIQQTAIGDQEITVLYGDYKRFGDLMLPTRIEQRGGGQAFVRTVDAVDFDPIDEAVFVLPDPIQELKEEAK